MKRLFRVFSALLTLLMVLQLIAEPALAISFTQPTTLQKHVTNLYASLNQSVILPEITAGQVSLSIPAKQGQATLIHILDAHGDIEGQRNISQIIKTITEQEKTQMILSEGAAGKLDPAQLMPFTNMENNRKLAEILLEEGEITGAEYFLMQKESVEEVSREKVEANLIEGFGVESLKEYRANLDAFRNVHAKLGQLEALLQEIDQNLRHQLDRVMTGNGKEFFKAWVEWMSGTKGMDHFLLDLLLQSRRFDDLNLESTRTQIEYPMLVRMAILKTKTVNPKVAVKEERKFYEFLEKNISKEFAGETRLTLEAKNENPRFILEKAQDLLIAKGKKLPKYSEYALSLEQEMYAKELSGSDLYREMEMMASEILERLCSSSVEKAVVQSYKNRFLFEKLLRLELSAEEWMSIQGDASDALSVLISGMLGKEKSQLLSDLERDAREYYTRALARDRSLFENIQSKLQETGRKTAIVVTGGFHAEGIAGLAREQGLGLIQIEPKLSVEPSKGRAAYIDLLMESSSVKTSDLMQVLRTASLNAQARAGSDVLRWQRRFENLSAQVSDVGRVVPMAASLGNSLPDLRGLISDGNWVITTWNDFPKVINVSDLNTDLWQIVIETNQRATVNHSGTLYIGIDKDRGIIRIADVNRQQGKLSHSEDHRLDGSFDYAFFGQTIRWANGKLTLPEHKMFLRVKQPEGQNISAKGAPARNNLSRSVVANQRFHLEFDSWQPVGAEHLYSWNEFNTYFKNRAWNRVYRLKNNPSQAILIAWRPVSKQLAVGILDVKSGRVEQVLLSKKLDQDDVVELKLLQEGQVIRYSQQGIQVLELGDAYEAIEEIEEPVASSLGEEFGAALNLLPHNLLNVHRDLGHEVSVDEISKLMSLSEIALTKTKVDPERSGPLKIDPDTYSLGFYYIAEIKTPEAFSVAKKVEDIAGYLVRIPSAALAGYLNGDRNKAVQNKIFLINAVREQGGKVVLASEKARDLQDQGAQLAQKLQAANIHVDALALYEDGRVHIIEMHSSAEDTLWEPPRNDSLDAGQSLGAIPAGRAFRDVNTAHLFPERELTVLERLYEELLKARDGLPYDIPRVFTVSDQHGGIERYEALILDALKSVLPVLSKEAFDFTETLQLLEKAKIPRETELPAFKGQELSPALEFLVSGLDPETMNPRDRFLGIPDQITEMLTAAKKQNPFTTLLDVLTALGLDVERDLKGKIYFHNLGDLMDRGSSGIEAFLLSRDLIEAGISDFIVGNHDLWEFLNLFAVHLPWYKGYDYHLRSESNPLGYADPYDVDPDKIFGGTVEEMVNRHIKSKQEGLGPALTEPSWWAEKLADFTAQAEVNQKIEWKTFQAKIRKKDDASSLWDRVQPILKDNADATEAWEKLAGVNRKIDVATGSRAVEQMSVEWWRDLQKALEEAYRTINNAGRFAGQEDAKEAWIEATQIIDSEIIPVLKDKLHEALKEGKWWLRVFEVINFQSYTSAEWWGKDWVFHSGWGTSVLAEINRMMGLSEGDTGFIAPANYLDNPVLKSIARFYQQNFELIRQDILQVTYMHAYPPVDMETGEFYFHYKGIDYRGLGNRTDLPFKDGMLRIAQDVRSSDIDPAKAKEALTLVNEWYADNTTKAKIPQVLEAINKFGAEHLAKVNGFARLYTGHLPLQDFDKFRDKPGFEGYPMQMIVQNRLIFTDGGMAERFGKRGYIVGTHPSTGILGRGYETNESTDIVDHPRTIKKTGDGEKVLFGNEGMSADVYLESLIKEVEVRILELRNRGRIKMMPASAPDWQVGELASLQNMTNWLSENDPLDPQGSKRESVLLIHPNRNLRRIAATAAALYESNKPEQVWILSEPEPELMQAYQRALQVGSEGEIQNIKAQFADSAIEQARLLQAYFEEELSDGFNPDSFHVLAYDFEKEILAHLLEQDSMRESRAKDIVVVAPSLKLRYWRVADKDKLGKAQIARYFSPKIDLEHLVQDSASVYAIVNHALRELAEIKSLARSGKPDVAQNLKFPGGYEALVRHEAALIQLKKRLETELSSWAKDIQELNGLMKKIDRDKLVATTTKIERVAENRGLLRTVEFETHGDLDLIHRGHDSRGKAHRELLYLPGRLERDSYALISGGADKKPENFPKIVHFLSFQGRLFPGQDHSERVAIVRDLAGREYAVRLRDYTVDDANGGFETKPGLFSLINQGKISRLRITDEQTVAARQVVAETEASSLGKDVLESLREIALSRLGGDEFPIGEGASSLGTKTETNVLESLREIALRRGVSLQAALDTAVDFTSGATLYFPGAQRDAIEAALVSLGAIRSDFVITQRLSSEDQFLAYLQAKVPAFLQDSNATLAMPLPVILSGPGFDRPKESKSIAEKLNEALQAGDLLAIIQLGEHVPNFVHNFHLLKRRDIALKTLPDSLLDASRIAEWTKDYSLKPLIVNVTADNQEIAFTLPGSDEKVLLDQTVFEEGGLDPVDAIARLRMIAGSTLRHELLFAAGFHFDPSRGAWVGGHDFVQTFFADYLAQELAALQSILTAA